MESSAMVATGVAGEMMAWKPTEVLVQIQMIQQLMKEGMHEGEHFGTIPGCGDKKVLMKSGAEKLGLMFRLAPKFEIQERDLGNGHREYQVTCSLYHINTEKFWGAGVGSCSTMETKYRWRSATRKCPNCQAEAIIKGKEEYGGGWVCFKKKGGCGSKWPDGSKEIESQPAGREENPDIADVYNTVLKMAKKRAQVDAMITATAASDIFTQDLDETLPEGEAHVVPAGDARVASAKPTQPAPQAPADAQNGHSEPSKPSSPPLARSESSNAPAKPQVANTEMAVITPYSIERDEKARCFWIEDQDGVAYKCLVPAFAKQIKEARASGKTVRITFIKSKVGTEEERKIVAVGSGPAGGSK